MNKIEAAVIRPGVPGMLLLNANPKRTLVVVGEPTGNASGLGGSVNPTRDYLGRQGVQVDSATVENGFVIFERGERAWAIPIVHIDSIFTKATPKK